MIVSSSKWFRGLLLASIYVLGVLGIVGSGGGGSGSGDCEGFSATVDCVDFSTIQPITLPEGGGAEGFDDTVNSIAPALDGSDDVYVGGDFTIYKNSSANRIARLNNDGSLDTSFITGTGFNDEVRFISPAIDGSGDVYVGGYFTNYNGTAVGGIARLNLDGTLDTNFITGIGFNGEVEITATAIDSIGDVYVGGSFTSYNGTTVGNGLIRLNDDGSIDAGFSTGSGWGEGSIAPATDGSGDVYVAGSSGSGVARLNNDGSIDDGFDTGPSGFNDAVRVVVVATDGSGDVYVAGYFSDYNGTGTRGLVRLNNDGSLDMGFVAGPDFGGIIYIITVAIDGSGDIYANTRSPNFIERLNNDGIRDTGFDTNLNSGGYSVGFGGFGGPFGGGPRYWPNSIALATDGSGDVYVVGGFTRYNFTPAARIARLTASGVFVR
jgi:uncharacterized delta-60 repeat protein